VYVAALDFKSALDKIYAKVASYMRTFPIVHLGIQLGQIRLDWFAHGVVHVRDTLVNSNKLEQPIIVFDPSDDEQPTRELEKSEEILDRLCEFIVHWNRDVEYTEHGFNCQDFVNALLKEFGYSIADKKITDNSPLGRYLRFLKANPTQAHRRILFRNPTAEEAEVEFQTHGSLDAWHKANELSLSMDETVMLKAFHRSFQCAEAKQLGIAATAVAPCYAGVITVYGKQ